MKKSVTGRSDASRIFHRPTLTQLNDTMCRELVLAHKEELDIVSSVDVQIHDVMGIADSMVWDFDMKDLWLTPGRWSMMIRQYLDPEEVQAWLVRITQNIGPKKRGIAALRTRVVKARGGAATGHTNKETRRWGSCMLGITYKAMPQPQITLYSRTSYMGYLAALDLSVAWMLGRYVSDAIGVPLEQFRFVWFNQAIQYHNFKSLAYLLNHPDKKEAKRYRKVILEGKSPKSLASGMDVFKLYPALRLSRKWMTNILKLDDEKKTYGDMNYNTYRRIRRRYHTEVKGLDYAKLFEGENAKGEFFKAYRPLPSTPIGTRDLSAIGMPREKDWGEPSKPAPEAEDWKEMDE